MSDTYPAEHADIRRDIALKLAVIARQTRIHFDKSVSQTGMTRSQWTLIAVVAGKPGASQKTIAAHLEMSEASTGRLIDRLCSDGLLLRQQHEDDRRSWRVYLTDAAQPLLAQMSALANELELELFEGFSTDDLEHFQKYLAALYHNVSAMRGGPEG